MISEKLSSISRIPYHIYTADMNLFETKRFKKGMLSNNLECEQYGLTETLEMHEQDLAIEPCHSSRPIHALQKHLCSYTNGWVFLGHDITIHK